MVSYHVTACEYNPNVTDSMLNPGKRLLSSPLTCACTLLNDSVLSGFKEENCLMTLHITASESIPALSASLKYKLKQTQLAKNLVTGPGGRGNINIPVNISVSVRQLLIAEITSCL